ncbi:MAG: hypothetical protein AAF628_01315 [Planctomycetota bacterium]
MNPAVLVGGVLAVCLFVGGTFFLTTKTDAKPASAETAAERAALRQEVTQLRDAHEEQVAVLRGLTERVDAMERSAARTEIAPATMPSEAQIRDAVAAYLAAQPALRASAPATATGASTLDVDAVLAELEGKSFDDGNAVWKRAAEAGILDALVERYEAMAEADPDNPDTQVDLGGAYLQRMMQANPGVEQGQWAVKADRAFDEALDIDPNHWEARFAKATSLSFWPPLFGKGGEAAQHFEILVEQQEASGIKDDRYAETYLFLGNLYSQQGKEAQAKEVWRKGYALYPGSDDLAGRSR